MTDRPDDPERADDTGASVEPLEPPRDPRDPFALTLGPPFALSDGAELLARADGIPGCYVSVRCACGASWRADLLTEDDKTCPGCDRSYTHVLAICPTDRAGMLGAIVAEVLAAHDLITHPDDQDDDQDDDDTEQDLDDDDDDDDDATEPEPEPKK